MGPYDLLALPLGQLAYRRIIALAIDDGPGRPEEGPHRLEGGPGWPVGGQRQLGRSRATGGR